MMELFIVMFAFFTLIAMTYIAVKTLIGPTLVEVSDDRNTRTFFLKVGDFYLFDYVHEARAPEETSELKHYVVIKSTGFKFHITSKTKIELLRAMS